MDNVQLKQSNTFKDTIRAGEGSEWGNNFITPLHIISASIVARWLKNSNVVPFLKREYRRE